MRMARIATLLVLLGAWTAASSSMAAAQEEEDENCQPEDIWLPATPEPLNDQPDKPDILSDCGAYRWSWQTFLFITQLNNSMGSPDFVGFEKFSDVFGSSTLMPYAVDSGSILNLAPRVEKMGGQVVDNTIEQAGLGGVLVDQSGSPVYYTIHMNKIFTDFIRAEHLNDHDMLANASPDLVFPKGALELKSSWQIVDDKAPPPGYITVRASVPSIVKAADGTIESDPNNPREVTVALLGLHVVGVIEDHPEFIWASFEHKDLAPRATENPDKTDMTLPLSSDAFPLYAAGTPAGEANKIVEQFTLDEAAQTLSPHTSVYRAFPGSNVTTPDMDEGVETLNDNVEALFGAKAPSDIRKNYELVGAVWLKNGAADFTNNTNFGNQLALLAGENGMSNVSMESFTQIDRTNCFSCHRTTPVAGLSAKKLNISHILSVFFEHSSDH